MCSHRLGFILYSKPDCHLCEGLVEKISQIPGLESHLQIRDITTQSEWWNRYQWEVPVLCWWNGQVEQILPRISPRASVTQVQRILDPYLTQLSSAPEVLRELDY
jgi:hypothetical protein